MSDDKRKPEGRRDHEEKAKGARDERLSAPRGSDNAIVYVGVVAVAVLLGLLFAPLIISTVLERG